VRSEPTPTRVNLATDEEDYQILYQCTYDGNPPPPSIRTDEEDYQILYQFTYDGNPPRPL